MRHRTTLARTGIALVITATLGACSTLRGQHGTAASDGLPAQIPAGLEHLPDPVPKAEPPDPHANQPYTVLGHSYTPDTSDEPFEQRGLASWYGRAYQGNRTASGETYDMFALTAAHPTLPIPSYARVTSVRDGSSVVVRINDRGPFVEDRVIDLSYAAAARLGIAQAGMGEVVVHKITAAEIAQAGAAPAPSPEAAAPGSPTPPAAAAESAPVAAAGAAAGATAVAAEAAGDAATAAKLLADPGKNEAAAAGKADRDSAATPATAADPAKPEPAATETGAAPAQEAKPAETAPAKPEAAEDTALPAGVSDLAPKAWAVQLGVFNKPGNASALAQRVGKELASPQADSLPDGFRQVRLIRTGDVQRVLIGDVANARTAQKLANRLAKILSLPTAVYHAPKAP